jgi:hypothetical protein
MAEREEQIEAAFEQGVSLEELDERDSRYHQNGHRHAIRFEDS